MSGTVNLVKDPKWRESQALGGWMESYWCYFTNNHTVKLGQTLFILTHFRCSLPWSDKFLFAVSVANAETPNCSKEENK